MAAFKSVNKENRISQILSNVFQTPDQEKKRASYVKCFTIGTANWSIFGDCK